MLLQASFDYNGQISKANSFLDDAQQREAALKEQIIQLEKE